MQNLSGTGNAGKAWVAWPPPGPFPMQAYGSGTRTLSATGWSIQTQRSITLTGATVTVTSAGANMPMTMSQLTGTYGESNAIRLVPMGWNPRRGPVLCSHRRRRQHADQLHGRFRRLPVAAATVRRGEMLYNS